MAQALGFIFSPGGIIVSLLVGSVWFLLEPNSPRPRRWLLAATIVYALASIHLLSYARRWLIPAAQGLAFSSRMIHDYAGLGYYGARGWLRF